MFEKHCVKCPKAPAAIPFFHGECDNLAISQQLAVIHLNIVNLLEEQLKTFAIARVTFGIATFSKEWAALSE